MANKNPKLTITRKELTEMREVDIRTVDRSTLVDAERVKINTDLSTEERIADYIAQIKNPYCYLYKGMAIKISFSGKRRLEDCMKDSLFSNN